MNNKIRSSVPVRLALLLTVGFAMIGMGAMGCASMHMAEPTPFTLTLIHNSDGESALLSNDYSGSVAQFATVVQRLRDEAGAENSLVVSSGDNFLAGLEYSASKGEFDAKALNAAGIEVSAIGNHEFDFGPGGFRRFVEHANFKLVSSNLDFSQDKDLSEFVGKKIFHHTIVTKGDNTIGIIGAVTDTLFTISSPGENVLLSSAKEALQAAADKLTEKGVKVIIALTHLQDIEEEKAIAQAIDGVDVFVAGGGDDLIGNAHNDYLIRTNRDGDQVADEPTGPYPFMTNSASGEPVAIISTDGSYNYVGKLVVSFNAEGTIETVDVANSGPVPVSLDVASDPVVDSEVVQVVAEKVESFKDEVIGTTTRGLEGTREVVRTQESTMGNAICDGYLYVARKSGKTVDFAFTNGGGIRKSIVVGAGEPVTRFDVLTALPFANYLTVINDLTVAEIVEIFEHSFSRLPDAGGNFMQVGGIRITYNPNSAVGSRVDSIDIDGETIYRDGNALTDRTYAAVTNSFIADGGDGYEALGSASDDRKVNIGYSYAEGFELYLEEQSPVVSDIDGRLTNSAE